MPQSLLRPRASIVVAIAVLVLAAGGVIAFKGAFDSSGKPDVDYLARGCALSEEILVRIWRGHHQVRSEDVTFVPRAPNFVGTFDITSHSGPWDYVQEVPLVLYGPGYVAPSGQPVDRQVHIVDIYPTIGRLLGLDLIPRDGEALDEALVRPGGDAPRLIVLVVWDGAGRQTLERWSSAWPTLAEMGRLGTSYAHATVGSSPSVTAAVHSSLGTGAWPRAHGVIGNEVRTRSGRLRHTFAGYSSRTLRLPTFADQVDEAFGNRSRVGLLAWIRWHVGMLGHGSALSGGDKDEVAFLEYDHGVQTAGDESAFAVATNAARGADIDQRIEELDRGDGSRDGEWLGHDITLGEEAEWTTYSNPAWAAFQNDVLLSMLAKGDYGSDSIPDLFFVNFKMTDLAGHQWGSSGIETRDVLTAQDAALASLRDYLDREVRDYVVILTADHGAAAAPGDSGGWPIARDEMVADLNRHFAVPSDQSLIEDSAAFGFYLNREVAAGADVSPTEVAEFLNGYTIAQNWPSEDLPDDYRGREEEQVFSAAFPTDRLSEIVECVWGARRPPRSALSRY